MRLFIGFRAPKSSKPDFGRGIKLLERGASIFLGAPAMSAWSVKTLRPGIVGMRGSNSYGSTTTATHELSTPPPSLAAARARTRVADIRSLVRLSPQGLRHSIYSAGGRFFLLQSSRGRASRNSGRWLKNTGTRKRRPAQKSQPRKGRRRTSQLQERRTVNRGHYPTNNCSRGRLVDMLHKRGAT